MDTQAIDKANNNTVCFYLKVLRLNKLYVLTIACRSESQVIIRHYLFTVSRLSLVSNVESNALDMTNLPFEIERELSMVTQKAGLGSNKQQRRQYTWINWDPSHEDKFVTETRDQPEPGSFFPRSL